MANNNVLTMNVAELQKAHDRNAKLAASYRAEYAEIANQTYRAAVRRFILRAEQINGIIEARIAKLNAAE
jgi:hypothetical protein